MSRPTEAQEMIEDILHSEGILSAFFSILWYRGNGKRLHQLTGINVPDTVIYLYSKPLHWFFSSKKGEVRKKSRGRLNSKHIEEQLMKHGGSVSGAKGCYLLYPSDNPGKRKKRTESLSMKYTFGEDVRKFLQEEKPNGMLQLFFDPKPEAARCGEGIRNATIETTWTPGCFMIEKRVNKHQLDDEKIPIEHRASTFAGDNNNWENMPVVSDSVAESFHKICEAIADHIRIVLGYKLAHLVLTFKIDRNDTIWLLYCSSMKVVSEEHPIRSLSADLYNPHVTVKYGDNGRRTSSRPPAKNTEDLSKGKIKCPLCLETLPVPESCTVKVKTILTCLSDFDDESRAIPPPLVFLFPMLTEDGYQRLKNEPGFANSPVRVCAACVTTLSRCAAGRIQAPARTRRRLHAMQSEDGKGSVAGTFHVPRVHKCIAENDQLRAGTMTRWPSPAKADEAQGGGRVADGSTKKPSKQDPLASLSPGEPPRPTPRAAPMEDSTSQAGGNSGYVSAGRSPKAAYGLQPSASRMLKSISPVYFPDRDDPPSRTPSFTSGEALPALKADNETLELYSYDVKGGLSKLGWTGGTSDAPGPAGSPRSPAPAAKCPLADYRSFDRSVSARHIEQEESGLSTPRAAPLALAGIPPPGPEYYQLTAEILAERWEVHKDVPPAASTNALTDDDSLCSPPPTPTGAPLYAIDLSV